MGKGISDGVGDDVGDDVGDVVGDGVGDGIGLPVTSYDTNRPLMYQRFMYVYMHCTTKIIILSLIVQV